MGCGLWLWHSLDILPFLYNAETVAVNIIYQYTINVLATEYSFSQNLSNEGEPWILTGMLFHTATPENERFPLNKMHLACGNM